MTVNGSAQAGEGRADRLSIRYAGIAFRLADPALEDLTEFIARPMYTCRAGMRSFADWKKRCSPKKRNRRLLTKQQQTNASESVATNFLGVDAQRMYFACNVSLKTVTPVELLILIDGPEKIEIRSVYFELFLSYCELAGVNLKAYRDIPQFGSERLISFTISN